MLHLETRLSRIVAIIFVAICLIAVSLSQPVGEECSVPTGNVIFFHPDGSGASMWAALRYVEYGPDGYSNWDKLDQMGIYRSHMSNSTSASSHGGATIHAYGVKVPFDTYGSAGSTPITAACGKKISIMHEARESGLATALVNSGHICEPGTGVFVANSPKRSWSDTISAQIVHSGVDIILSGGEKLMLPEGTKGRHGVEGVRKDGRNLIDEAKELGYTVVLTRDELLALPDETRKVLGVFSASHTFNAAQEDRLAKDNLPHYNPGTPTIAEMTRVALRLLKHRGDQFFMVVEEEGTDNFANSNNAGGTIEALRRADQAIGVITDFIDDNPNTLMIMAADSDAGGFQMISVRNEDEFDRPLPEKADNGAPLDGVDGPGSLPFVAKPDANGTELRFGVVWSCYDDVAGSIIARAHGLNADLLSNNVDNTDIYRIMYATLFGTALPPQHR